MDKKLVFSELVELEKKHAGIMDSLTACKGNTLRALGEAHAAFISTELSPEAKAQIDALNTARASLVLAGLTGKALSGIDAQVKTLQGDSVERAWQAYKSILRPTNGDKTKKETDKTWFFGKAMRCPFDDDCLFAVFTSETERKVYKLDVNTLVPVAEPAHLVAYKVKALSNARALVYAIHNNTVPGACHDGVGHKKDGLHGGTAIHVEHEDAVVWANKHAPKKVKKS